MRFLRPSVALLATFLVGAARAQGVPTLEGGAPPKVVVGPGEPVPPLPRDYFLNPPARGTWLSVDAYTVGGQANLERRQSLVRDDYAAITPRITALGSLGYGELSAHTDVRFLFFNFGVSGGVRRVWRNYEFAPGVEGTREARTAIDDGDTPYLARNWAFGEARARIVFPVADWLTVATTATVRYEACPDNSFDWFHTTMHDGGVLAKYEASVLFRHPSLGVIGPSFRAMSLPRNDRYETEIAGGFTVGRRLGLIGKTDLLLLNVLVRPGDDNFGFQLLKMPVYGLLAYRVSLSF